MIVFASAKGIFHLQMLWQSVYFFFFMWWQLLVTAYVAAAMSIHVKVCKSCSYHVQNVVCHRHCLLPLFLCCLYISIHSHPLLLLHHSCRLLTAVSSSSSYFFTIINETRADSWQYVMSWNTTPVTLPCSDHAEFQGVHATVPIELGWCGIFSNCER